MIRFRISRPQTPAGEQLLAALDEQQRFSVHTHGEGVVLEVWGAADAEDGRRVVDEFLSRLAPDWQSYLDLRED